MLSFQVEFFVDRKLSLPLLKGANRDLIQKFFEKIIILLDSGDFFAFQGYFCGASAVPRADSGFRHLLCFQIA